MKKNSISLYTIIIVVALLFIAAANSFAAVRPVKANLTEPRDTPYLAMVKIELSGMADTPYLSFSVPAPYANSQVNTLLKHRAGYYHVIVLYYNKEGALLEEEEYYLDNNPAY